MTRPIAQPALYGGLVVLAAAVLGGAMFSLSAMDRRLAALPVLVVAEKGELEAALEDAPWFALEAAPAEPAPVVYLLSDLRCPECRALERRLQAYPAEVRLIVAAPREASEVELAVAAELARRRDAEAFQEWLRSPERPLTLPVGAPDADLGAAAQAGYAELARASADRLGAVLAANGESLSAPALFWARGREWRAAVRPTALDLSALRRDLATVR